MMQIKLTDAKVDIRSIDDLKHGDYAEAVYSPGEQGLKAGTLLLRSYENLISLNYSNGPFLYKGFFNVTGHVTLVRKLQPGSQFTLTEKNQT